MDCVKAQQLIKPYLDGYLSDRELEEFLTHVETCPDCFDELEVYFSVYRTLADVDEKGDYNFRKKLRGKMEESRGYLRRRYQSKALRAAVIFAAELALAAVFWELVTEPAEPAGAYESVLQEPAADGRTKPEEEGAGGTLETDGLQTEVLYE